MTKQEISALQLTADIARNKTKEKIINLIPRQLRNIMVEIDNAIHDGRYYVVVEKNKYLPEVFFEVKNKGFDVESFILDNKKYIIKWVG